MPIDLLASAQRRLDNATRALSDGIKNGVGAYLLQRLEEDVIQMNRELVERQARSPRSAADLAASQAEREARWQAQEAANRKKLEESVPAETASAMKAFRTAARKVEKLIAAKAAGERNDAEVYRAIDKLYSRANKAEIRGHGLAAEEAEGLIDQLRQASRLAEEAGYAARRNANDAEIARLKEKERDARARMDPALRAYQDELKGALR